MAADATGELRGASLLGFGEAEPGSRTFHAIDPTTGERLQPGFYPAEPEDVEGAAAAAEAAFGPYAATAPAARARFLRAAADGLERRRGAIVERADRETALGEPRLGGELTRTANQLRLFAEIVEEGRWVDALVDEGDPERVPAPKPDVRSMRRPLGPVAVFGASNFPLAFSVAGGDTASALAAGCPVVFKAHPAHPGTCELVGRAVADAARETGMPDGTFSLIFDDGFEAGQALVRHPAIRAVGFTGSRAGGRALMALAAARPEPIPVYAEMSSVNPVFVLPLAAHRRGPQIADGLLASFTLGTGQFCTNPGLVLVPAGEAGDALRDRLAEGAREAGAHAMLTAGVHEAYRGGLRRLAEVGAHRLADGKSSSGFSAASASVWETTVDAATADPRLTQEVFGPSTVLVRYAGDDELLAFTRAMEGQLTATLHGEPDEWERYRGLVAALERKAGRLIVDQYPTGVEVCRAMVHGGPFPATSDGTTTSVGARAVLRFTRLVAYQNFPKELLPAELR